MAENLIINATAAAAATGGETTAAWTVAESTGAPTDAELRAILDVNGFAVMQTGASTAEKAAVAFCILDSLISGGASDSGIDLSTRAKRKTFKLKKGLHELEQILDQLPVANV